MSSATDRPRSSDDPAEEESHLFTYALPFLAALFLALGILGSVLGAWTFAQPAIGGCGNPEIGVFPPEEAEQRAAGDGLELETLDAESLSDAERRALEEAIADPQRTGTVEGTFENREAFDRGVLVRYEGETWYATIVAQNRCLAVDPLALPLGLLALLVGVGAFTLVALENYPWEFRWPRAADGEPGEAEDDESGEAVDDESDEYEERAETDVRHPESREDDREQ